VAFPYSSPGVTVREIVTAPVVPLLGAPELVAVVGTASGEQQASESIALTGTSSQTLKYTGVVTSSVVVKDGTTGYTVSAGAYAITAGTDPNVGITGDEPYSIARKDHPGTAPTVVVGTGTLTGTYVYAVSFVHAGGETGIGPESTGIALTAQGGSLSAIPLGPAGTTSRKIYRKKTAGTGANGIFRLVATINDNTTAVLANETLADATAELAAQPLVGISSGGTVVVSYEYTDQYYYEPTLLDDYDTLVDKYGAAYDDNGNISSTLSFAARLMFLNGASEVVAVAAKSSSLIELEAALGRLETNQNVRIVYMADGTAAAATSLAAHVQKMNNQGFYRFAVAGRDGVTASVTEDTLRQAAAGINHEGVRLVSPTNLKMQNPVTGADLYVGGQYLAAAVAGMYAARDVHIPLTRKSVAGFLDIKDARTASNAALDSASGLLVVENMGGTLRVRHDLTTAVGSVNSREASVVRAKYEMAHRLRNTLDRSIIGTVAPTNRAPLHVEGAVSSVLEQLMLEQIITGYADLKARVLESDPTTVEVRYQYTPSYPINNILVLFTINTTTGNLEFA
jgi:hypothetical protein